MGFNCRGYGSASVGFAPPGNELQEDGERIQVKGNSPSQSRASHARRFLGKGLS